MMLPSVVAWEVTRRCMLSCQHCRAHADSTASTGEDLSTGEGLRLIESLAGLPVRLLILTGGEPMMREDVLDLAGAAAARGIRVVMAPCGMLMTEDAAGALKRAGVSAVSLSLDAASAADHDAFRGVSGAFDTAVKAARVARAAGLGLQINTTVSQMNVGQLPSILELAKSLDAATLDCFFLVPTGRGAALRDKQLNAEQMEQTLNWILDMDGRSAIRVKTTCAPQVARLRVQRGDRPQHGVSMGGCLAGRGFLFVSHTGVVQPCGFLKIACGDVRALGFDLRALLEASEPLRRLERGDGLSGACAACAYRRVCGGCRARSYAYDGNMFGGEPFCVHSEANP